MNKEIEEFKRFAKSYLRWSHFNMDRIVKDAVRRQELIKQEEDNAKIMKPLNDFALAMQNSIRNMNKEMTKRLMEDRKFFEGTKWSGDQLRIRLPLLDNKSDI